MAREELNTCSCGGPSTATDGVRYDIDMIAYTGPSSLYLSRFYVSAYYREHLSSFPSSSSSNTNTKAPKRRRPKRQSNEEINGVKGELRQEESITSSGLLRTFGHALLEETTCKLCKEQKHVS